MASPQTENGFTRIANEILEHLTFPGINGSEYRIAIFVIRKTYGFGKKKDRISLTQFQKGTYMNRPQAVRTIKSLVSKRILLKEKGVYVFNKNWEEWVVFKRIPSIQIDTTASIQTDTKGSIQKDTHKRKTKETITKERNTTELRSGEIVSVIDKFEDTNPSFKKWYGNTTQRSAIGRMLETHGTERLLKVVALLPRIKGKPYFPTITTPLQLEDKWASLETAFMRLKNEKPKKKIYV